MPTNTRPQKVAFTCQGPDLSGASPKLSQGKPSAAIARLLSQHDPELVLLHATDPELALGLGFRVATGFHERPIYRDLFPRGLTALDPLCDIVPGIDPDPSQSMARREIQALLEILKLPIDDRGRRRAAARAEWFAARGQPLDTGDILVELPR